MARFLLLLLAACHLGGCVSLLMYDNKEIYAEVNSRAEPAFNRSLIHAVVPLDAAQSADPQFRQLAEQTARTLSAAGLTVLSPGHAPDDADLLVTASFTVGEWTPYSYTSYRANYIETGIESSRSVERVNKRGEKVTTTTYTPRTEFAGLVEYEQPSSRRDITLVLTAKPRAPAYDSPKELWSVTVNSENSFLYHPATPAHLLKAAQGQIGRMSKASLSVRHDDVGVIFIRTGRPARERSLAERN